MKKKNSKFSRAEIEAAQRVLERREFLRYGLVTGAALAMSSPLSLLGSWFSDGLISSALAETAGVDPRRFIYIALRGGPARWVWDLLLADGDAELNPNNGMVATRLNTLGTPTYKSFKIGNRPERWPWLWKFKLPTSGKTMAEVLHPNMFIARGINNRVDSHDFGRILQVRPNPAAPSVTGLVADHASEHLFDGLGINGGDGAATSFASRAGKSLVPVNTFALKTNGVRRLMAPFSENRSPAGADKDPNLFDRKTLIQSEINQALDKLRSFSRSRSPGASTLYSTAASAERQLQTAIADVDSKWGELTKKYWDTIQAVINSPQWADLLGFTYTPAEITAAIEGFEHFATSFALLEYGSVNNLTRSFTVTLGDGMSENDAHQRAEPNTASMHLKTFSLYFAVLSACLELYISSIGTTEFADTIIQVGSEFSRAPRLNERGSDHGWEGNLATILSGAFTNGPIVGGSIHTSSPDPEHPGRWGHAAETVVQRPSGPDSLTLTPVNLASTVAGLVGVIPNPAGGIDSPPMARLEGSTLKSLVDAKVKS